MGRYRTPSYWWDFEWKDDELVGIVIESDYEEFLTVCRIPDSPNMIERADKIVKDLEEGRLDPRRTS